MCFDVCVDVCELIDEKRQHLRAAVHLRKRTVCQSLSCKGHVELTEGAGM